MRAEIHKWGNLLLPTMYHNTVNEDGQVNIEVQEGGSPRGQSGLCIHLENDAAMMASGITENEFCDFRDIEYDWDFENGTVRQLRVNDWQLHAFNQINDANRYARSVLGITPPQAEVGVGFAANLITKGNDDQPLAACLGFPEGKELLVEFAATLSIVPVGGAAVGAAGLLATPLIRRDIFLPETAAPRDSRGVVTHEYGHFIMCSILHDINPNALLRLFRDRLPEGTADARDDHVTVQSEAFADFIMTQVVSGANYSVFNSALNSNAGSYCVGSACVEENFRGTNELPTLAPFNDESRRFTSLLHDAVDQSADLWRADSSLPTNADAWISPASGALSFASVGYLTDTDDAVALPGRAIPDWWEEALDGCRSGPGIPSDSCRIDPIRIQRGLVRTMIDNDDTWCEACALIMSHSKLPEALSATTRQAVWRACVDTTEGRAILGPPPHEDLRLDAATCKPCRPGTISTSSGRCMACNANETVEGNRCVVCPPGSIIDSSGTCVPCGPTQVSDGNRCVDCDFFQVPDRSANVCADCVADATLDWSGLADMCPTERASVPIVNAGSNDNCPDQFWLQVTNIDDAVQRAASGGTTLSGFEVFVTEPIAVDRATCENAFTTVSALMGAPGDWTGIGGVQGFGTWKPESCAGELCIPASCTMPVKFVPGSEVLAGQRNMRLLGLAQQRSTLGVLNPAFGLLTINANVASGRYDQCDPK